MHRRRLLPLAALAVLGPVTAACGSSAPPPAAERPAPTTVPATTTTVAPTTTLPTTTTTAEPGTLPQTEERPAAGGPEWEAAVAGLWQAIVTDDPAPARPFFFPLTAYRQVKGISDPDHDYRTRLIPFYEDDVHTLHRLLGGAASRAALVGIEVPATATWIKPGVEYNKGAYWRVLDSKLAYTVDGQRRTMTVKSMISWRGRWYVVHLSSIR